MNTCIHEYVCLRTPNYLANPQIVHEDFEEVMRLLRLMCEGHCLRNQDILRSHPYEMNEGRKPNELMDSLVDIFECLSEVVDREQREIRQTSHLRHAQRNGKLSRSLEGLSATSKALGRSLVQTKHNMSSSIQHAISMEPRSTVPVVNTQAGDHLVKVSETILELIQGPCRRNQTYLVWKTQLVTKLNAYLSLDLRATSNTRTKTMTVKITVFRIFRALLEGRGNSLVEDDIAMVKIILKVRFGLMCLTGYRYICTHTHTQPAMHRERKKER